MVRQILEVTRFAVGVEVKGEGGKKLELNKLNGSKVTCPRPQSQGQGIEIEPDSESRKELRSQASGMVGGTEESIWTADMICNGEGSL